MNESFQVPALSLGTPCLCDYEAVPTDHTVSRLQGAAAILAQDVAALLCYREFYSPASLKIVRTLATQMIDDLLAPPRNEFLPWVSADTTRNYGLMVSLVHRLREEKNKSFVSLDGVDLPLLAVSDPVSIHWLNIVSRFAMCYVELFESCPETAGFQNLFNHARNAVYLMNFYGIDGNVTLAGGDAITRAVECLRDRLSDDSA
jgi:hypothetical protein